ncbi:TolC family protein [Thalassoroseus pseudoceratinae]|uniref:TolC family protein n=1 Tax=Thalassoroseus pseudoceratinae TaxID=2713176 RepID=UPI001421C756|nr:TolC family protein [Thalassoroseus pseudoceratinae]
MHLSPMTHRVSGCVVAGILAILAGCASNPPKLHYLGDADLNYYKEAATQVEYPLVFSDTTGEAMATDLPRTIEDRRKDEIWDLSLEEALHLALENNAVIRTASEFRQRGGVLANATNTPSIYDPAIQESGVLFGGRGVESALSAFDPTLNVSMNWGRDEQIQNSLFFNPITSLTDDATSPRIGPAGELVSETGNFQASLQKQFASGGQLSLTHTWLYSGVNNPNVLFPSSYTGLAQLGYRQPLLAGAGTEFTRIAGPIAQSFGGLTGVNQGVVITRINADITIAQFETSVRNLARDVERLYWQLYLQYRLYDIAVVARNSALRTWREVSLIIEAGGARDLGREDELQAKAQYFETRALVKSALSNIYSTETQLRRIMGQPVNDGRIIRPIDEPPLAKFVPDWHVSLAQALTNRVELRTQKFNIKSLELQLQAAKSLTKPRLDFVSSYNVNGFGDDLFGENDNDGRTSQGLASGYETMTQGDQTGWGLGFEMTWQIGLRSAHAQVRNLELRLAKAREALAVQEMDISHEVAATFQDLAANYGTAEEQFNRRTAAAERVEVFRTKQALGSVTLDLVLRAQRERAAADQAYYTSLVEYSQSIADYHYFTGSMLEANNIHIGEGGWRPEAYHQALRRAWARSYAFEHDMTDERPAVFASEIPVETVPYDPAQLNQASDVSLEIPNLLEEDAAVDTPLIPVPEPAVDQPAEDDAGSSLPIPDAPKADYDGETAENRFLSRRSQGARPASFQKVGLQDIDATANDHRFMEPKQEESLDLIPGRDFLK